MAGLSDTLTQYRTKLTAAGFTNLPEGQSIDDLPATSNKVYRLSVAAAGTLGETSGGGSLVEYRASLRLEVFWLVQVDSEAIWNTIGTDLESLSLAMLKVSNRNSGTVLVLPDSTFGFEEHPAFIRGTATFSLRYRIAQDMT